MNRTVSRALGFAVLVTAAAGGGSLVGGAQTASPSTDVLPALLIEVRGLRAAMEQMASAAPRIQLTLGRLQLQEQRIVNQVRRLDTLRASLAQSQKELDQLAHQVNAISEGLRTGILDADAQRGREELKEVKALWTRKNVEVQRLLGEESVLVQDVDAEQNRWADFNRRLEDLERALERR